MGRKTLQGLTSYFQDCEANEIKLKTKELKISVSNYFRSLAGYGVLKQGSPTLAQRDQKYLEDEKRLQNIIGQTSQNLSGEKFQSKELHELNSALQNEILPTDFFEHALFEIENLDQTKVENISSNEKTFILLNQILNNQKEFSLRLDKLSAQFENSKNKPNKKITVEQTSLFINNEISENIEQIN